MSVNVVRGRRHRGDQIKFFTINEVAEALHVSTRTVRDGSRPAIWSCTESVVSSGSPRAIYERF